MTRTILPAMTAACALVLVGPAYAQRGHGSQPHAPKAPTTHASQPHGGGSTHVGTTHGPSTHGPSTAHGSGAHATTPTTKHGSTHNATTTTTSKTDKAGKLTTTTTTTTSTTTTSGAELTAVQQKLLRNSNLSTKLQARLPDGMTVQQAALGFRNLGQFVAAVNVSNNLDIPFADLKTKMLGGTYSTDGTFTRTGDPTSLGQSIHVLRPDVDADTQAMTATRQANATLAGTSGSK